MKLVKTCMEENYLIFKGQYYKQLKGALRRNHLFPFVNEIFVANLETKLASTDLM